MTFQLPPFLVQSLYKDLLFDFTKDSETAGDYEKLILILVNYTEQKLMPENDLEFLTNILKACALSLKDIRIINLNENKVEASQLIQTLKPLKVLFFGTDIAKLGLPLQFPDFQVQAYDDRVFLGAPALNEISSNAEIKKKLWQSLQKMFIIS